MDPEAVAVLHVADSLAAIGLVGDAGSAVRLLDLGSGGGFPGLPLAAALSASRVTLADSVAKKARFLETVAAATGLSPRVEVAAARAETLPRGRWDVVTARAVGPLPELIEIGLPLLHRGGRLLAWKRGAIEEELEAGRRAASALGGSAPIVVPTRAASLRGHVIVTVVKERPTPSEYPRDPAARRRRAW